MAKKILFHNELVTKKSLLASELSAVFENNAAGENWTAVHDNMLPLVQFAYLQELYYPSVITGEEKELLDTFSQIQAVIRRLNRRSEKAIDENEKSSYKHQADNAAGLLQELKSNPENSSLIDFYQLFIDSWEDYKNWMFTYRLLSNLVKLGKGWENNPEARMEFLQIKEKVLAEWKE